MRANLFTLSHLWLGLLLPLALQAQWQTPRLTLYGTPAYTLANSSQYSYTAGWGYAVGARLLWRADGDAYWVRYWDHPAMGFELSLCSNPHGVAGDKFGAEALLQHPLWPKSPLYFQLGCGLSYYTEPYSRTHNELNRHIGSYLNCLVDVGLMGYLPLSEGEMLSLGLRFLHSSNGYLKKPNNGLNYLQGELGFNLPVKHREHPYLPKFQLDPEAPWRSADRDSSFLYHDMVYLSYAPGLVQSRHSLGTKPHFYTYTAQFGMMHMFHPSFAYGFNVDIMFNYSHKEQFAWYHDGYDMMKIPFYVGAVGTFESYWGPLSVRLSLGGTLLKSTLVTIPYYERVGLFYHYGHRRPQFLGVSLKAYGGHIDYIEWNYGLEFRLRPRLTASPSPGP